MKIKVVELIEIDNFCFGYLFIRQSGSKHCSRIYISLVSFHKLQERYVNFVNNVTIILSDEETTKIKVVDLDKFYNFNVHDFFS